MQLVSTSLKPHSSFEPLVALESPRASLCIWEDGRGELTLDGREESFGREIGRYALRRLYLGDWDASSEGGAVGQMLMVLDGCMRCRRLDCRAPIPERRRLMGFDRDHPTKWCSTRCQCTEATRRYLQRKRA